jgi:hypothetical protein
MRAITGTETRECKRGVKVRSSEPPRRAVREWCKRSSLERRIFLMAEITLKFIPIQIGRESK